MKSMAILGLGLMGGSLGLALKDRGFDGVIKGYARRHETCEDALRRRMVDEAFDDPVKAVEGVDLAVLCVPILSMAGLVSRIKTALKPGCLLTDVGSTKEEVDAAIRSELSGSGVESVSVSACANDAVSMVAAASRLRRVKCFMLFLPLIVQI